MFLLYISCSLAAFLVVLYKSTLSHSTSGAVLGLDIYSNSNNVLFLQIIQQPCHLSSVAFSLEDDANITPSHDSTPSH